MAYIYLTIAFLLNAFANIFLKLSSIRSTAGFFPSEWNVEAIKIVLKDKVYFFIGILLFASNVLFYYLSLKMVPISVAYPVMVAMSILIINGFAYIVFQESISSVQIIGYATIVLGVTLVMWGMK